MTDDLNDPLPFAQSTGIFLSAAPADEGEAARLGASLASYGLPILPRPTPGEREAINGRERIQRDIAACELFVPLVSAGSNLSADAPFRAEWQQAAERAAAKTGSLPFLVPLVTENVSPSACLVPEPFRSVPWVNLPPPGSEAVLAARLQEMLRQHESFRHRHQSRQTGPVVVPVFAPQPDAPVTTPDPVPLRFDPRRMGLIAGGVVAAVVIAFFVFRSKPPAPPTPLPATAPLAGATPAPTPLPLPIPASAAEATRIFLPPTLNLTGDSAVSATTRTIDPQLARAFSRAAGFKVETGSASADVSAALAAARRAAAGILVLTSVNRTGENLELHTQVLFATSGVSYGTLGPLMIPAAATETALTEFLDRATTGVVEASDFLQKPPTNLSKLPYGRPWARWPLAQQIRAVAALPPAETGLRIAGALAALREDVSMLDARIQLARAYRDAGRYDEADSAYGEIFARRALVSEAELHEVIYERALLIGSLPSALASARERAAMWPRSPAIDDVVSCLFALNRPGTAATELSTWLAQMRSSLSPADLTRRQNEVGLVETLAHVRHGETARAQTSLSALKNRLGPTGSMAALQLEALVFARAGSQSDFDRLIDRVGDLTSAPPLAALRLAYTLHCQLLHAGRPSEAAHFLERTKRLWSARPAGMTTATDVSDLLLEADLSLAQGRPADTLTILDRASPALIAARPLDFDGRRALALQDLGRTADISALLTKLERVDLRNSRGLPLYWRARLAARAGLQKSAVELLRLAIANGLWLDDLQHFATSYGRHEPEFANLRGLTGYDDLIQAQN